VLSIPATAYASPAGKAFDDAAADPVPEPLAVNAALADQPLAVVAVVAGWSACGLLIAFVAARRGHAARPIAALGVVLGPLLLGLALANLRSREQFAEIVEVRPPRQHGGTTRVLVAMCADPNAVADALPVLRSPGIDLAEVCIGTAVNFEDAAAGMSEETTRDAVQALERAAVFLEEFGPGLVILPGRSKVAVCRSMDAGDTDMVLVVGDDVAQSELCRDQGLRTVTMVMAGDSPAR
jgi:hypothetical protein